MRLSLTFFGIFLFSPAVLAELTVSPLSATQTNCPALILYRCVCRADFQMASGGVSSIPIQVNGTSTVVYSPSDLSGKDCEGTLSSNHCVPPVLVGQKIIGKYTCALGTANSSGGFDIR